MYLAMDDLGDDNIEKIMRINNEMDKWKLISDSANRYGFSGIQINPSDYSKRLGLSLNRIPGFIDKFRLTYHIGGVATLESEEDYKNLNNHILEALNISAEYGVEDVSFHPPFISDDADTIRDRSKRYLSRLIESWIPKFIDKNITLSLETHVTSKYFVFKGLRDYSNFVSNFKDLGVLIDISHNFYDKYSVDEILNTLSGLNITGLHLSDAIPDAEFNTGTHLPIGKGEVNFRKIVEYFNNKPNVYGALEIRGSSTEILESVNIINSFLSKY
jgi:sugar phosphate isomerase/epimerase